MPDPRRVYDSRDIEPAVLYAKRALSDLADAHPILSDSSGYLLVNMTVGTVTLSASATLTTIDNVLFDAAGNLLVNMTVGTISLSSTASTITNAVGNPVNVALTSTVVTVSNTLRTVTLSNTAGTVTNTVSSLMLLSKTLTGSTGSISVTNATITVNPTGKAKVYAFSLTTTSATEVTCVFHSGPMSGSLELWRCTLQAPSGANSGANLAVTPPGFLFASRTGTAVSLSLSTAVMVHYSVSFYDEA